MSPTEVLVHGVNGVVAGGAAVVGVLLLVEFCRGQSSLRTWFVLLLATWSMLHFPDTALSLITDPQVPQLSLGKSGQFVAVSSNRFIDAAWAFNAWFQRAADWLLVLLMAGERCLLLGRGFMLIVPPGKVCSTMGLLSAVALALTMLMACRWLDVLVVELIGIAVAGLLSLVAGVFWVKTKAWLEEAEPLEQKRMFLVPLWICAVRALKFMIPFYSNTAYYFIGPYGVTVETPLLLTFNVLVKAGAILIFLAFNPSARTVIVRQLRCSHERERRLEEKS